MNQPEMSTNPNTLIERIDAALKKAGMSRFAAEEKAGLGEGYIRKIKSRGPSASTSLDNLMKLAAAIGCPVTDLAPDVEITPAYPLGLPAPAALDIPILGTANGSTIGAFQLTNDPIGHVSRPPGLMRVDEAYALYIRNESMWPRYPHGDLVFVHPHKPARSGEGVIVQVAKPDGTIEAYIKELDKTSGEWLIVKQLNPPAELKFKADTVHAIHKVMTTAELFNA